MFNEMYIKYYQIILMAIATISFVKGTSNFGYYCKHKNKNALNYIGMCIVTFIYSFSFYIIQNKQFDIGFHSYQKLISIFLSLLLIFHIRTVSNYCNLKSIYIKISQILLSLSIVLSGIIYFVSSSNNTPIFFTLIFGFAILFSFLSFAIIWQQLDSTFAPNKNLMLKFGFVVSIIAISSDYILFSNNLGSVMTPIAFFSTIFPILFFSQLFNIQAIKKSNLLNEKIEKVKHNARVSSLSGTMSHDIKNALNILMLNNSLITKLINKNTEKSKEIIIGNCEKIQKNSKQIEDIITNHIKKIRCDSKQETSPNSLYEIIDEVLTRLKKDFVLDDITIEMDIAPGILLECRKPDYMVLFSNLITNSIESIKDLDEKWIRLEARNKKIYLTDSGESIPPHILSKLFMQHFTTKDEMINEGIGLSVTREILMAHNHKIYYNPESENTQFIIDYSNETNKLI